MIELDPAYGRIGVDLLCGVSAYLAVAATDYMSRISDIKKKVNSGSVLKKHSGLNKVKDYILQGGLLAERQFLEGRFDLEFKDINEETLTAYKQSL